MVVKPNSPASQQNERSPSVAALNDSISITSGSDTIYGQTAAMRLALIALEMTYDLAVNGFAPNLADLDMMQDITPFLNPIAPPDNYELCRRLVLRALGCAKYLLPYGYFGVLGARAGDFAQFKFYQPPMLMKIMAWMDGAKDDEISMAALDFCHILLRNIKTLANNRDIFGVALHHLLAKKNSKFVLPAVRAMSNAMDDGE
ncbi:hypothetical protein FRC10_004042 [Ceratobasidium sp. 414]|nr:hypothetical protein FRC10_004042 [Ceratobasidium sp. 414]